MGCAGPLQFQVDRAPDYQPATGVSVLGVFKDGRMSPESWDSLGSTILRKQSCSAAYDAQFTSANRALASAVDDQVRSNGVSDALLAKLAPAATGDAILILTVAGRPPQAIGVQPNPQLQSTRRSKSSSGDSPLTDGNAFEVSASLYSIKLNRRVAIVSMKYTGSDTEDALKQFADRLAVEMPIPVCSVWNWKIGIDEKQIRAIKEE